jgi:SAM-dependent methyltransferase
MHDFYTSEYCGEYSASETISCELARQRLEVLKKNIDLGRVDPVLEIGCAHGEFLAEISALGIQSQGVEPSHLMASQGRDSCGLNIFTGVYDDLPERVQFYGLICLFHVLEHVPDPLATLRRIRQEIKPDGHLFLEVPTLGDCQLALVFKSIHPTTFVRETLEVMLSLAGFTPVLVKERGYHLQVLARPDEPGAQVAFPDASVVRTRVAHYLAKRFSIIENILGKLGKLVGRPGGAIYGAGLNTLDLDLVFPLGQLKLEAAFDADPKKQGREILGLTIFPPADLHNWQGRYLIISSYAFQEEICQQLHLLQDRGIELITLYDKGPL